MGLLRSVFFGLFLWGVVLALLSHISAYWVLLILGSILLAVICVVFMFILPDLIEAAYWKFRGIDEDDTY